MLSSPEINSHNTFEEPGRVVPVEFKGAKIRQGTLELTLPAKSVVVLAID
jgi:alpha-N-arabinofuranosidase